MLVVRAFTARSCSSNSPVTASNSSRLVEPDPGKLAPLQADLAHLLQGTWLAPATVHVDGAVHDHRQIIIRRTGGRSPTAARSHSRYTSSGRHARSLVLSNRYLPSRPARAAIDSPAGAIANREKRRLENSATPPISAGPRMNPLYPRVATTELAPPARSGAMSPESSLWPSRIRFQAQGILDDLAVVEGQLHRRRI
jgi:hypothetical protein